MDIRYSGCICELFMNLFVDLNWTMFRLWHESNHFVCGPSVWSVFKFNFNFCTIRLAWLMFIFWHLKLFVPFIFSVLYVYNNRLHFKCTHTNSSIFIFIFKFKFFNLFNICMEFQLLKGSWCEHFEASTQQNDGTKLICFFSFFLLSGWHTNSS